MRAQYFKSWTNESLAWLYLDSSVPQLLMFQTIKHSRAHWVQCTQRQSGPLQLRQSELVAQAKSLL